MLYSFVGIMAIILHVIINYEYITGDRKENDKEFRTYLGVVLAYYVTDSAWGAFHHMGIRSMLYADTVMYFILMAASTILWCRYVLKYLNIQKRIGNAMMIAGALFCIFEVTSLVINGFTPIYFTLEEDCTYHPELFRYISISLQVALFGLTAVHSATATRKRSDVSSRRVVIICLFCILMMGALIFQVNYSLFPMYTMGLIMGTCLLHVFVREDEKKEYRMQLQAGKDELRENNDIIANAGYGIWKIQMSEDGHNTMEVNDKLKEIFGIMGMDLSPEQLYRFYHDRLQEDVHTIESEDYTSMKSGELKARILTWQHPTKGNVYLHAGGSSYTTYEGKSLISGFCGDVTTQRKHEIRASLIIDTLARSYEFLNYIRMKTRTFITTSNTLYNDNDDISEGDVLKAIRFACEQRISPSFRKDMEAFSDLSTIDVRMEHRNVMINQFKDMNGVWHEWSYIVADRNEDGSIKHLIWALRRIEDEKQAEIRKQQIINDNIAANKAKTMFLQNMSHEIRTPLNTMFGFSQLLGLPDGSWTEDEKEQYNKYIFNSYNMLDMLIGDIIDIADSEHGNYRIEMAETDVNSVCRNALVSVEYRKPADVRMYFTSDLEDGYVIVSDGKRIQQVLINYLTNACKHTRQGEIHLHCSKSENPGKLTFSVTDTGIGIPPEKSEMIFNRFAKLDQFVPGSGLGLNICLMIADKLDGKVYLDKEYSGGARFVFVVNDNGAS